MNCHTMNNANTRNDDLSSVPIYDYNDDLESKESVLSFSFDHIYAITPDNLTFLPPPKDIVEECTANLDKVCNQQTEAQLEVETLKTRLKNVQTELAKLKKLASVHLDLIQKQSDLLTSKEKQNKVLLQENETLRSRNNRQKQNPPPLINFPAKPQTVRPAPIKPPIAKQHPVKQQPARQHLLKPQFAKPVTYQHLSQPSTKLRRPGYDPCLPSTSGYVYVKKPTPALTQSKIDAYKSEIAANDTVIYPSNKARIEFYTPQGNELPIFATPGDLGTTDDKLPSVECDFSKTDFDIYSIVKSTSQQRSSLSSSTLYGSAGDLDALKIKEEILDTDNIFDKASDSSSTSYRVEKSCRDFSYGESLSNINPSVLSTLSDPKATTSQKSTPWWSQPASTASADLIEGVQTHYETMARKRSTSKGKGKGKGKKSHVTEPSVTMNDETTNKLIRNMFIASDVPEIPEKISPPLIDEPKVKNRFFRSKLVKDGTHNIKTQQPLNDPGAVYTFDAQEDKIGKEPFRNETDIFDFCIAQQDAEPLILETPLEQKKKKHIYDPPTKSDVIREPKRMTSPSASVYSFEDSQDTKVTDKNRSISPDVNGKIGKSRAFGLFGTDVMETSTSFDAKKGRRKSTTSSNLVRGGSKNSRARNRANSLFSPNNPAFQRDRFIGNPCRGRQRAQSTGSHTSVGSRSKSSCDLNLIKLNSDLEFKNRCFAMITCPGYDFINPSKFANWKGREVTTINTLEVPKWRIKTLKPAKVSKTEQEEKLDDNVFAKRHSKMELEEKRIKRWDYQRLKEQLHLKKLKERQEKLNPSKKVLYKPFKPRKVIPQSLWPNPDDVLAVEVANTIPVSSFGELVPSYKPRKFSLPWLKKKRLRNNSEKKTQLPQ